MINVLGGFWKVFVRRWVLRWVLIDGQEGVYQVEKGGCRVYNLLILQCGFGLQRFFLFFVGFVGYRLGRFGCGWFGIRVVVFVGIFVSLTVQKLGSCRGSYVKVMLNFCLCIRGKEFSVFEENGNGEDKGSRCYMRSFCQGE